MLAKPLYNIPLRQELSDIDAECSSGYNICMTTKKKVMRAVETLPENASIEHAMEKLYFLAKIERGIEQADAGKTMPHYEVKARMSQWLK